MNVLLKLIQSIDLICKKQLKKLTGLMQCRLFEPIELILNNSSSIANSMKNLLYPQDQRLSVDIFRN